LIAIWTHTHGVSVRSESNPAAAVFAENLIEESRAYREVEDGGGAPVLERRQVVRARRRFLVVVRTCKSNAEEKKEVQLSKRQSGTTPWIGWSRRERRELCSAHRDKLQFVVRAPTGPADRRTTAAERNHAQASTEVSRDRETKP